MYITGAGSVSPAVATGAAPLSSAATASLPKPTQNTTVTVGSTQAVIDFIGITPGLVGVVQINFTVPNNVNIGTQPVVVSVNGVSSSAANLRITN